MSMGYHVESNTISLVQIKVDCISRSGYISMDDMSPIILATRIEH
jgi:hypothetical protein